ncbi:hypothetical protein BJ912DRAFT_1069815 [Pholiota molesta]|nr:hypothetical protein BJ912DRAFT_1069815 [Pholiota molesta]
MENLNYGQFTTITYDAEDQRRLLSYIPDSQPELIRAVQLQFNIDAHGINTLREYERVKRMLENTRHEYERVKQMASDNYDYLLSTSIPEFTAPFFYTPLSLDSPPYDPNHNVALPETEEYFVTPPESPEPGPRSPTPQSQSPVKTYEQSLWEPPEMQDPVGELAHANSDVIIAMKKGISDVTVPFDLPELDDDPIRSNPEASRLNRR